jgi:hypothetical protein
MRKDHVINIYPFFASHWSLLLTLSMCEYCDGSSCLLEAT